MVEEEAAVVEEGEGLEVSQEMALCRLNTMMVGMIAIGAMVGVEVEAEVVASVAVEGEGTMALRIPSKMLASTIKKHPCRAEAVDVGGELVVGDVVSELLGRSMEVVLKGQTWKNTEIMCYECLLHVLLFFLSSVVTRVNRRLLICNQSRLIIDFTTARMW